MISGLSTTLTCPKRGHWISFQLVDEHGDGSPYSGLVYELSDTTGQKYMGMLNDEGKTLISNIYCGPAIVAFSTPYSGTNSGYTDLIRRETFPLSITALQVAAEQSPSGPKKSGQTYKARERAEAESATFYRVEVRDFVKVISHLPDRDNELGPRPPSGFKAVVDEKAIGVGLAPNRHHVLEVKALRAYSPLLSRGKAFCALNNYHLSLMTVTAYAPFNQKREPKKDPLPPPYHNPGSIAHVLQTQLGHLVKPTLFDEAGPFHLLCEEVPYSKRLEIMPHDPERYKKEIGNGWDFPEKVHFLHDEDTETQAFITHNDKVVLISVRGTQGRADVVRDIDARQVPYAEGEGQAHRGFYEAFLAAKEFTNEYLGAFHTGEQTLIVCGHSLGGAIALLLAEWLRREWSTDIQLYTFGSPRAGDRGFALAAKDLAHHRIVNHNDPVPGVPYPWMDIEWRMLLAGNASLVAPNLPLGGVTTVLAGLLNLQGDPFEHHGEQRHYMPGRVGASSEGAILWQPGCSVITDLSCSRLFAEIGIEVDMPRRKGLVDQVLSAAEHSSHSGYSRSALTNLLRWLASVTSRGGMLFTQEEVKDIDAQVRHVQKLLDEWQPDTYQAFRNNVRRTSDPRFSSVAPAILDQLFDDSNQQMRELLKQQLAALKAIQHRLEYQALKVVTHQDLFGDLVEHPGLPELISAWRDLNDIQHAEQLAQRSADAESRYV